MIDRLLELAWYALLLAGVFLAFRLTAEARRLPNPIDQARQAAKAFGIAGVLFWALFMFEEIQTTMSWDLFGVGVILLQAAFMALVIQLPMWGPWLMLRKQPVSGGRKAAILFLAGATSIFGMVGVGVAAFMFLFANSLGEYLRAMFTVALPVAVFVMIALTLARVVRKLP